MSHQISKHFEIGEKNSAAPRVYDLILNVWISDEALFLVFKKLLLFSFKYVWVQASASAALVR